MIYTHTWDTTGVSGVSFGASGGASDPVGFNINVNLTTTSNQWSIEGPYGNY